MLSLTVQGEAEILVSDINESSEETQKLFAQLVIQACLPLQSESGTIHRITAGKITRYCQSLLCGELGINDEEVERAKLHLFAILRGLFGLAGGRKNLRQYQNCLQHDYTLIMSLGLLGSLVGVSASPNLQDLGTTKTLQFLCGYKVFEDECLTENVLQQRAQLIRGQLLNLPPIDLPAAILADLSRVKCIEFRIYKLETAVKFARLKGQITSACFFLCWRSGFDPSVEVVSYVRSPKGRKLLQSPLEIRHAKFDVGFFAVSLLVMHWFFKLQGTTNHREEIRSGVDCLKRFHSLLHGEEIPNAQWVVAKQLRAFSPLVPEISEFLESCGTWNQLKGDDVEPDLEGFWRHCVEGDSVRVAFHKAIRVKCDVSDMLGGLPNIQACLPILLPRLLCSSSKDAQRTEKPDSARASQLTEEMDAAVEEHRPKLVPFQTRILEDASTPAELETLLPALYRIGPDDADLAPPRPEDSAYLEKELGLGRLAKLSSRLWIAGRPMPPRPLHYQRLLGREIVVAEQMDLHLVWTTGRIYLKPMPRFLLEPHFWSRHLVCHGHNCSQPITTPCHHPKLWKSALGFLFSYAALICHESDFSLAKEKHLLPEEVAWADWRRFVAEHGPEYIYDHIDKRFHFGELRLSRLNKLQLLTSGFALRLYMPPWDRYGDFFRDNFTWLASVTVYIAVVLTAMEVGLATTALTENEAFQSASYGFIIFSILGPLIAIGLILVVFLMTFVSNWALAMRFRNRRLSDITGVNNV